MFKKLVSIGLSLMMMLGVTGFAPTGVKAADDGHLGSVTAVEVDADEKNVVWVTFDNGYKGKVTFLDEDIFRYNVDPSGRFNEYAQVYNGYPNTAKIQQYPDSSDAYSHPEASVQQNGNSYEIKAGNVTISFDEAARMSIKAGDKTVMEEKESLDFQGSRTVQTLVKHDATNYNSSLPENYFGGGTQNGRFVHTGNVINISNESNWVDGGVASPSPFYYTTNGYGVLRNTYMDGSYDFGSTDASTVTARHNENEFDAYYFVSDADNGSSVSQDLLQGYFKVTGNPALLPMYGFYLGHLNAYNRDAWSDSSADGGTKWEIKGNGAYDEPGDVTYENGGTGYVIQANQQAETLNGYGPSVSTDNVPDGVTYSYKYSARAVLDEYKNYDIPFGFFLPNDGYGAGYGQNGFNMTGGVNADGTSSEARLAAVAANVANLKDFADYAKANGVATGLWTQSNLTPDSNNNTYWHVLRDFSAEVGAGVTTLKTDVAWVGYGYSFQLSGVKQAYDIITTMAYEDGRNNTRPNIISLDGWAGSQRYNSVWTGDQTGGNWEYIRFHIPTFIGQSMSGNPNIGSDMDGIWGGAPIIATRDYQWKSFAPQMLDMDGWGSYAKGPYVHGDPYTGISRMYLKLKAQMMPYTYTNAYAAANIDTGNGDQGLPMVRAMLLEYPEEAAAYTAASMYQYMWGENLLVAPVYQDTNIDEMGNDVRDGIYLPGGEDQIWIDYFTGEQYRGGQTLNNFDAPIWKLPLFVKNGAIIPMYAEHNSADMDAEDGVDKTQRLIEFWPAGDTYFNTIEDDGEYIENNTDDSDKEYGVIDNISYGPHVETKYTSSVDGTTATLTAEKSTGSYEGYDQNKDTTFIVHASEKPAALAAYNGDAELEEVVAESKEAFDAAEPAEGTFVSYYDASPAIETYASAEETNLAEMVKDVRSTGKLYVKFANTDSQANAQKLVISGFVNDGKLSSTELNPDLEAPVLSENEEAKTATSITVQWDAVENADSYQVLVDGMPSDDIPADKLQSVLAGGTSFTHAGLEYTSTHTYRVRAVNEDGYSEWSNVVSATTKDDPFLNIPDPQNISWTGYIWGSHTADLAFDHIFQIGDGGFHSNYGGINEKLTVDYGNAYLFDKIEYYPRDDAGNGTATKLVVETSLDGVHWVEHGPDTDTDGRKVNNFAADNTMKTIDLSDPNTGSDTIGARYIRFTALESVGTFFSASEIMPYAVAGENTPGSVWRPFTVGNITSVGTADATLATFQQMYQKESSAHGSYKNPNWVGEIQNQYGDINFNGISDIYDYAYTAFRVDGGTTKTGSVSGKITLQSDKDVIAAGEEFTISVTADNVRNLNAYGTIINYDPEKVEFVAEQYLNTGDMYTQGMTGNIVYDDGTAYVNHNAINMGDKDLLNGSMVLSTITMRAKEDITLNGISDVNDENFIIDLSTVTMMGPDYSTIESTNEDIVQMIDFGYDDFDITMTNEFLPTDDGTNVEKLIQGGSQAAYQRLFDGNISRDFELLYDIESNWDENKELPEYVELPITMHLDLKEASLVDQVKVYNANRANGYLLSAKAQLVYTDGTTSDEIAIDEEQSIYEFNFEPTKLVDRIDITFVDATHTHATRSNMLTLAELEIIGHVPADSDKAALQAAVTAAEQIDTSIYTDETVAAFEEALNEAKAVLANVDVKQDVVDAAVEKLLAAQEALERKDGAFAFEYGDFTFTMTNEFLPSDDGTNVNKLIQGGTADSYGKLFDGVYGRDFELLWDVSSNHDEDGELPDYVELPLTLHMTLNEPAYVDDVTVYNANKANGYLTSAKAQLVYTDGTTSDEIVIDSEQEAYTFTFNSDKTVERIDVTFLTADSTSDTRMNMLTLAEITANGRKVMGEDTPDKSVLEAAIAEAEQVDTSLYTPQSVAAFTEALNAAKAVNEDAEATQEAIDQAVNDLAAAKAGLVERADKSELNRAITAANAVDTENCTDNSVATLKEALAAANALLDDENASQDAVDAAVSALDEAVANMVAKASDAAMNALQLLVDNANAMRDDYSEEEFADVLAAINEAQALLDDRGNTTPGQMVSATLKLSEAIRDLNAEESVDALRADVQATIDFINEHILTDVEGIRPGKVTELREAVEAAKTVLEKADASADELKAANEAMTKAVHELWEIVTKDELNAMITAGEGYLEGEYTQESKDALQSAIDAAKNVAANEDATVAEVSGAISAIADAIAGLERETLDTSALEHEIELVSEMLKNIDDYIPSTVEGLEDKLNEAKETLTNATTQAEIDEATEALREARLNARTYADKEALQEAVNAANKLDLSLYTAESRAAVEAAVNNAKSVLANELATQEEVDKALEEVNAAVDSLVKAPAGSTNADQSNTGTVNTAGAMGALMLMAAAGAMVIGYRRKRS